MKALAREGAAGLLPLHLQEEASTEMFLSRMAR